MQSMIRAVHYALVGYPAKGIDRYFQDHHALHASFGSLLWIVLDHCGHVEFLRYALITNTLTERIRGTQENPSESHESLAEQRCSVQNGTTGSSGVHSHFLII